MKLTDALTLLLLMIANLLTPPRCFSEEGRVSLDLTKAESSVSRPLGVPAAGISSTERTTQADLPLAVVVSGISRVNDAFTVQVRLTNTGHEIYRIPVKRSLSDVLKTCSNDRRMMRFAVLIKSNRTKRQLSSESTASCFADTSSFLLLPPGDELSVLLPLESLPQDGVGGSLVVELSEARYDDKEYRITAVTSTVSSPPYPWKSEK